MGAIGKVSAAAFILMIAVGARAEVIVAVGTEFQVNTYTTNDQTDAAVCKADDGAFIVAWEAFEDGDGNGIRAQRYDSAGEPAGTEFQVNTYTSGGEWNPQICCSEEGNFVVTWFREFDGSGGGVFAQRFEGDGSFAGTEFQVNTYTSDWQVEPSICCDAEGNFVIAWESAGGQDGNFDGVFAQRFRADGAFRGTEFQVNTFTFVDQGAPAICCAHDGDFVVAWEGPDEEDGGIFGQRFASNGAARGTEFQINSHAEESQEDPAICCDFSGNFAVVWEDVIDDPSISATLVSGQRYNSSGVARGTEFQVSSYTSGLFAEDPTICCGHTGSFVVAWAQYYTVPDSSILARNFAENGNPINAPFQVSTYTSFQIEPAIACDADSGFVVVWDSQRRDGDDDGIFGQRFALLRSPAAPVLSWLGLGAVGAALVAAGMRKLRKR